MKNKKAILGIIVVALAAIMGLLVGKVLSDRANKRENTNVKTFMNLLRSDKNKVSTLLNLIDNEYVDEIATDSLTEEAMSDIISKLDPHSVYIPAEDLADINSEIEGSFVGIGVQFSIQEDTVMVVDVISGGPSEKAGILPGDRIIAVNDSVFVGKDVVSNRTVMKTLRGKKGTEVKIKVRRLDTKGQIDYTIVRDDIPVESLTSAFIIEPNIGFLGVNSNFGTHTYEEFLNAIGKLKSKGADRFIIDLRNNGGGLLDIAIQMINEFLPKEQLIVYAKGKSYPRSEAFANGTGSCINNPIVVLIDEFSASASEIFAGAIQDNDRGTIIGRRSFGKGLVQSQIPFSDGSAVRLTVARYYTPSGRCIQKPYIKGKGIEYDMELLQRFEHGELYNKDSIQIADSLKYKTLKGRTVYGGGGIMPDIFVARDTTEFSSYAQKVSGQIFRFAFHYTDNHRNELKQFSTWEEIDKHINSTALLNEFVEFAKSKGIQPNTKDLHISRNLLINRIKSNIVRNILNENQYFKMINNDDKTVKRAIEVLTQEIKK